MEFIPNSHEPDIYKIKLYRSGTNLYLTAAGNADNANVSWEAQNYELSQEWKFENVTGGGGSETIIHSNHHILGFNGHGRCVNIYSNSAAHGNNITLYDWTNSNDQSWSLVRIGTTNNYYIKSAHTGLYLGYTGATYNTLKSCNVTNNSNNAIVTIETINSSRKNYRIKMSIGGVNHYLTAWAGTSQATSRLIWHTQLKTYDQIWKFVNGTSHPLSHTSSVDSFRWPASNDALVNDGYDGLWRQYTSTPGVTTDHKGTDLSVGDGNCYSMFTGIVRTVNTTLNSARGRYVEVVKSDGKTALYQHLAAINTKKCVKDKEITKGDIIGTIGGSGTTETSYGVHLHFEVKNGNNYIDPLTYFD